MNWTCLLPDNWGSFFYGVASVGVVGIVIVVVLAIVIFVVYPSATDPHQECDVQPEVPD